MTRIDNTLYSHDSGEFQDLQQAQVAALRAFYPAPSTLPVVDYDDLDAVLQEHTEITVTDSNLHDICAFLRDGKTWLAFKPAVIERDGRLVVIL